MLTYENVYDIMYLSTTKQHKILKQHSKNSNSKIEYRIKVISSSIEKRKRINAYMKRRKSK